MCHVAMLCYYVVLLRHVVMLCWNALCRVMFCHVVDNMTCQHDLTSHVTTLFYYVMLLRHAVMRIVV